MALSTRKLGLDSDRQQQTYSVPRRSVLYPFVKFPCELVTQSRSAFLPPAICRAPSEGCKTSHPPRLPNYRYIHRSQLCCARQPADILHQKNALTYLYLRCCSTVYLLPQRVIRCAHFQCSISIKRRGKHRQRSTAFRLPSVLHQ